MSKIIKACQVIGKYEIFTRDNKEVDQEKNLEVNPIKQEVEQKDKNESKDIIAQAQEKAKKIIAEAEKEKNQVAQIREKAYNEGFKKGEKAGFDKGYADGLEKAGKYKEILKTISENYQEKIEKEINKFEKQLIQLAVEIAGIIVNHELDLNPELINNIVKGLLADLGSIHQELIIKVHPTMLHYLEKEDIAAELQINDLDFISDSSLQKGDCVVETNFGGKEGLIEKKLDLLAEKLYEEAGLHAEF